MSLTRPIVASLLALASSVAGPSVAQAPPGGPVAPVSRDTVGVDPVEGTDAATRLRLGRDAAAAGRSAEAVEYLLAAHALHPGSPAVCRALVAAVADDPDARALFGIRLASALVDARGRASLDRGDRDLLLDRDGWPAKIAAARAAAVQDLARQGPRLVRGAGSGVVLRWCADLALEIGRDTPGVLGTAGAELDAEIAKLAPDAKTVVDALRRLLVPKPVTTTGDEAASQAARRRAREVAVRAARILTGLAAQAGFKDLEGPPAPDLGDYGAEARAAKERLRAQALQDLGEPWTVARLEALTAEQRLAFTEEHASWAWPGVAVSPNGLYTVETICGFDTLLAVASSVEDHHRRLANWYGSDPFAQRPGLVRVEPEHDGLESQGAPFWWAGGFQGGDVTTIRAAWTSKEGVGRTLTHELTHRFDGVLKPFQPNWLTEGKAVWTGQSYRAITSREFVEDLLNVGTCSGVFVKGYGNPKKLGELVTGEIEDYRDNYPVGYALFSYLRGPGPEGDARFREPLERFMANGRAGRRDPLAFFTSHFADGKQGRPADFDAFAAEFQAFLSACYRKGWGDLPASEDWIEQRHKTKLEREGSSGLLGDRPTWSWARNRAEPWFGQGHAAEAGALLASVGEDDAAAAAWAWSLQVDGWDSLRAPQVASAFAAAGEQEAAWATWALAGQRFAAASAGPLGEAPMLRKLAKVRALLTALRDAAEEHRAAGRVLAAAWLDAEHDDLARLCGVEEISRPLPATAGGVHPRRDLERPLGAFGWVEDGLTGYEERRHRGLWFATESGDLHVGRAKPRDATGLEDRASHQRHAWVRSAAWEAPGEYVVRARIHFTTSFVSGAVVLGSTRRDRDVRIGFRAGDFLYAIGRKEGDAKKRSVQLSIDGLFEREGPLRGSRPGAKLEFEQPASFFDLELWVSGPTVRVVANGEERFSYTTPDGRGIEGAVGFAMGQGAVRVQTPRVQRFDRHDLRPPEPEAAESIPSLVRRAVGGFPAQRDGTLVLWLPDDDDVEWLVRETRRVFRRMSLGMEPSVDHPQQWVVMVPRGLPEAVVKELREFAEPHLAGRYELREHVRADAPDREHQVLFVDDAGVIRAAGVPEGGLPPDVASWARHYRSR